MVSFDVAWNATVCHSMPTQPFAIVDYQPCHRAAFAALNYAWIEQYFTIEAADRESLDHPEDKILAPGGAILMAVQSTSASAAAAPAAIGTCALIPMANSGFELAKMAVAPQWQGHGVGRLLGTAAIARATDLGARRLWLESNTVLGPALALYRNLGFQVVPQAPSDYARSNIQMSLTLPAF